MRKAIRTAIATVGVVVGIAATPAAASAAFPTWSPAGATEGSGTLRLTHSSGANFACNHNITANLLNNGTANGGSVTTVALSLCTSSMPSCFVSFGVTSFPWQITKVTGDPSRVGMAVAYVLQFSGTSCSLNGVTLPISGAVQGDYNGAIGELSFVAEPGLSSLLGPFVIDGRITLRNVATTLPVDLV